MEGDPDTLLGGPGRAFPTTSWNLLVTAAAADSEENRAAWDRLVRRYWKPVYAYIRRSWRKPNEESKDLCQGFFLWLIERGDLKSLSPEWSSFRGYLKTALAHYLTDAHRHAHRRKRGAGTRPASLDTIDPASVEIAESGRTPDEEFDLQWARSLLAEALRELEETMEAQGKKTYFDVFAAYFLASPPAGEEPGYRDLAERFSLRETDVGNYLVYARRRLQEILRERVRDSVLDEASIERELSDLLSL